MAGACFALLSIVLGAFVSHFLKPYLDLRELDAFDTGIRYMMYHGLSMLILAGFEIPKITLIFRLFFGEPYSSALVFFYYVFKIFFQ